MLDERDFAISSDDFLDTLIGQFVGACTSLRKVRLLAAPDRFFKQPFPSSRWADTLFKVIDQNKSTELLELELREKSNDERFVNRTWVLDAATVLKQDFSNLRSLTLGFSAVDKGGYDALGSAIATLPSLEKFILLFNGLDGNAGEMLPLFSGNSRASRLASLEVCLMHKANFCFNESDDDPLLEYIDALADAVAENGAITSLALRVFVSSFNILETLVDSLMRHASQMDSHVQALVLHIQLFHLLYQDERATSNFQRIWSTLLKFLVEMPSLHTLDLGGLLHKKLSRANRDAITAMMRKDVRDLSRNLTVLGLLE
ncbi:hypothetical protein BJ742DRAFT_818591 [Cladochytrium replicatum]|nr:hypothetical protein BJ742DRAFT_818591 [Cladochytrium replicatum]